MTMSKITMNRVREIIQEEAKSQAIHAAKAAVSSTASDLLGAIDSFREKATPAAISSAQQHLDALAKLLDHMTDAPGAYVDKPKSAPKRVSLKAVKSG